MSDNEYDGGKDDYGGESDEGDVSIVDEEEVSSEDEKDDIITGSRGTKRIPDHERITSRFMTKYEKARILGTRAL
jgi:DNA-directed RNA polymerase I, II, and III subunit RPABC2